MTVLTQAYQHTCEICDLISKYASKSMKHMVHHFEVVGTAKAAQQLYQQGYHKEAKAVMLQLRELKKND